MENMNLKQAISIAKRNSTLPQDWLSCRGWWFRRYDGQQDRVNEGLHPTRNDINRHGRPERKKKGSLKQDGWYK